MAASAVWVDPTTGTSYWIGHPQVHRFIGMYLLENVTL